MGTSSVNVGRDVASVSIPLKREDITYATICMANFMNEPIIGSLLVEADNLKRDGKADRLSVDNINTHPRVSIFSVNTCCPNAGFF
jgi:hypothetical protein